MAKIQYTYVDLYKAIKEAYDSAHTGGSVPVTLPVPLRKWGRMLEKAMGVKFLKFKSFDYVKEKGSNTVLVPFSGGKDSAALAYNLKSYGYGVELVHFTGVNKAYPDEAKYAKYFADKYNFPLSIVKFSMPQGTRFYTENPVKNYLLMMHALTACNRKALFIKGSSDVKCPTIGCSTGTPDSPVSYGWSDGYTAIAEFSRAFKGMFDLNIYVGQIASEQEAYRLVHTNKVDFADLVSCMLPTRFRGVSNRRIIAKGIKVRPNGCGNCYKCAFDYLNLVTLGVMEADKESTLHYAAVLFKQKERYLTSTHATTPEELIVSEFPKGILAEEIYTHLGL